jgi:hypothetical protein
MIRNPTSFTDILWRQKAWLTGFPAIFTLAFAIAAGALLNEADMFSREGVRATAEVLDLESRRERMTGDGGRTTRRHVVYTFTLPDGSVQRNREPVSRGFYEAHEPGDTIRITYLADDPGISEVEEGTARRDGLLSAGLALAFGVATIWIGRLYWRRAASMHRAVSRGERRHGRIIAHIDVTPPKVKEEDRRQKIRWIDDLEAEGESLEHGAATIARWPVGEAITLHVDPATGTRWWIEDVLGPDRKTQGKA